MISNSNKMNFILDDAKQNLNEELNAIIENKITSIRALINDTIKNNINDALQSFYKPDNKLKTDTVLNFKLNIELVWKKTKVGCFERYHPSENAIDNRKYKTNENKMKIDEKVLKIDYYVINDIKGSIYIGKKFMIVSEQKTGINEPICYKYYEHNLPLRVILIIKILWKDGKRDTTEFNKYLSSKCEFTRIIENIINLINISLDDPLLFYSNAQNFEAICEEEYKEINNIKKELLKKENDLQSLLDKENEKIEYYEYLDNQVNIIEEEQKKNMEEKQKLKMASEKIKKMKHDFEEEKRKFEEEKEEFYKKQYEVSVNNFDIDSYLKNEPKKTIIEDENDIDNVNKLDNKQNI